MAVEARRGCGYRKVGGLYLIGGKMGSPCCKMPIILEVCPTCNQGVKQSRGWQWIDPTPWLKKGCADPMSFCPATDPATFGERAGLLWIGTAFYPTPEAFLREASEQGISRRIQSVPRGLVLGESYVFLAHPKVKRVIDEATGEARWLGGVFRIFRPDRIEKIVTETQAKDEAEMERLRKANVTPFIVPDDDKDHQGSVYDKPDEDEPADLFDKKV